MNIKDMTHSIHSYHAKYIPEIPKYFLDKYSKKGDTIFDPFCGSGTTMLEAMISERNSVGVDISFIAYKISKANDKLKKIERIIETDSLDVYTKEHGNITVISIETVGEIIEGND